MLTWGIYTLDTLRSKKVDRKSVTEKNLNASVASPLDAKVISMTSSFKGASVYWSSCSVHCCSAVWRTAGLPSTSKKYNGMTQCSDTVSRHQWCSPRVTSYFPIYDHTHRGEITVHHSSLLWCGEIPVRILSQGTGRYRRGSTGQGDSYGCGDQSSRQFRARATVPAFRLNCRGGGLRTSQ